MAPQKRKRAPGGGRKPKGAVAAKTVALRMPDDLRAELAASVRQRRPGWTFTDEVIGRLRGSLAREDKQRHDPALTALLYLIGEITKALPTAGIEAGSEHASPFWFVSFRLAVGKLLEALQPPGEIRPPELPPSLSFAADIYGTPEQVAQIAASHVLFELKRPEPPMPIKTLVPEIDDLSPDMQRVVRRFYNQEQRNFDSMVRAGADLGIKTTPAKSKKGE